MFIIIRKVIRVRQGATMRTLLTCFAVSAILMAPAFGQKPQVPSAKEQIATAVLPLPAPMRAKAGVIGYAPDMTLVTLRNSNNGMVCTATQPGDSSFDVRCYHESLQPIVRRMRELHSHGLSSSEISRVVDSEIQQKKLTVPDQPTAGYRMLGPIGAYSPATNTVGREIESWQSIHFPYKTAAQIGLAEEGQVPRTTPYVMSSGTFWSHVMIEHEDMNPQ